MADFSDLSLLQGLQNLLKPRDEQSDEEEDEQQDTKLTVGLPLIKSPATATEKTATKRPYEPIDLEAAPKNLEQWNCLVEEDQNNSLENLPSPEYEIIYKQRVNTEDVYLQMGNKTPATSSCEDLIVKIHLTNDTTECAAQMQLDITTNRITLRTRDYLLKLPLPQTVDPDKGAAQWDSEKKIFTVTLRIERELDLINF